MFFIQKRLVFFGEPEPSKERLKPPKGNAAENPKEEGQTKEKIQNAATDEFERLKREFEEDHDPQKRREKRREEFEKYLKALRECGVDDENFIKEKQKEFEEEERGIAHGNNKDVEERKMQESLLGRYNIDADPRRFLNIQAFSHLTSELTDEIGPELEKKGTINILYPGAGSHIAPFEIAIQLFEKQKGVEKVKFFYTDLNDEEHKLAAKTLIGLARWQKAFKHTSYSQKIDENNPENVENKYSFEYTTQAGEKKTFELIYNITQDMSRPFQESYGDNMDIFISHDGAISAQKSLKTFIEICANKARNGVRTPHAIFFEDYETSQNGRKPTYKLSTPLEKLPGKVKKLNYAYGCREDDPLTPGADDHFGKLKYENCVMYIPDMEALSKMTDQEIEQLTAFAHPDSN